MNELARTDTQTVSTAVVEALRAAVTGLTIRRNRQPWLEQ